MDLSTKDDVHDEPSLSTQLSTVSHETDEANQSGQIDLPVAENTTSVPSHPPGLQSEPEQSHPAEDTSTQAAQHPKFGPYSDRYYPHHQSYRLSRDELREIAAATLDALDDGFYYPPPPEVADLIQLDRKEDEEKETNLDEIKKEENEDRESNTTDEENKEGESKTVDEESKEGEAGECKKTDEENKEGENGESKKVDEESEVQDGSDEKVHSEERGEDVSNHRKAGREPYDLKTKIRYTKDHTRFVAPDDEMLSLWFQADFSAPKGEEEQKKSRIIIAEYSTLVGARRLQEIAQGSNGKIGVLNFASAKKPGGGFLNGSQAQEESLARSSTLYASLLTPTAKQFYRLYSSDPDNAFYTHSMVYSPSVVLFRDDKGDWTAPLEADILTSAAVNAGDVRKQIRWEEEMRALRERVRVAELARRRELALPTFVPTHVRIYESEPPQKDNDMESGQQSLDHSEQPSTGSAQVSPIIFAADPPSPPPEPLSLPASHLISPALQGSGGGTSTSQVQPSPSPYPHPPNIDLLAQAENLIAAVMYERIARILYLFHLQGAKHLVLGSFGTGVFQNSVELIAGIFRDLLCSPEEEDKEEGREEEGDRDDHVEGECCGQCRGKFEGVFDTVMFAILGGSTVRTFRDVFEGAEGVEFDEEAGGSDVEGMKDSSDFRGAVREACAPPA